MKYILTILILLIFSIRSQAQDAFSFCEQQTDRYIRGGQNNPEWINRFNACMQAIESRGGVSPPMTSGSGSCFSNCSLQSIDCSKNNRYYPGTGTSNDCNIEERLCKESCRR
jgi:hypothetical protein